uniref:Uncharacterized protein n=1 Tax=Anguilla anguilla TaxID=7936 RepID=A0A0E9WKH5_ANGAN
MLPFSNPLNASPLYSHFPSDPPSLSLNFKQPCAVTPLCL